MERGEGLAFGDGEAGQSSAVGVLISRKDNTCSEVDGERCKARQTE